MFAIYDKDRKTYYTGDSRAARTFGTLEDAKLYRSVKRAVEAICDVHHPMHRRTARNLIVVSIIVLHGNVLWEPGT